MSSRFDDPAKRSCTNESAVAEDRACFIFEGLFQKPPEVMLPPASWGYHKIDYGGMPDVTFSEVQLVEYKRQAGLLTALFLSWRR